MSGVGEEAGGSRFPGIVYRRPATGKILYVPSHENKIVFQSGGKNNAVSHGERLASQFGLPRKKAPPVRYRLRNRQETGLKPVPQIALQPLFEARTALSGRLAFNTLAEFAPRDHTRKEEIGDR